MKILHNRRINFKDYAGQYLEGVKQHYAGMGL